MALYFGYKNYGCKNQEKEKKLQELAKQYPEGEDVVLISDLPCRVRLSDNGEFMCWEGCPLLDNKKIVKEMKKENKKMKKEIAKMEKQKSKKERNQRRDF